MFEDVEKDGGGGGGERECIVRSHSRRLCEEEICFPRDKPREERRREMIDSSSMSCFGQHWERIFFV